MFELVCVAYSDAAMIFGQTLRAGKTEQHRGRAVQLRDAQRNIRSNPPSLLKRRGLPVTPGTLYLAHFTGAAGAVAVLSALEEADAATTMASADATGRTKREKLVNANPFLARFTVADLKSWADRKMRTRS